VPKFIFLVVVAGAMAIPSASQSKAWTPPKTSWGDPDIQGMWPGTDLLGVPPPTRSEAGNARAPDGPGIRAKRGALQEGGGE
jgi:hypothetical protein